MQFLCVLAGVIEETDAEDRAEPDGPLPASKGGRPGLPDGVYQAYRGLEFLLKEREGTWADVTRLFARWGIPLKYDTVRTWERRKEKDRHKL